MSPATRRIRHSRGSRHAVQREHALQRAQRARSERAAIKRRLSDGSITVTAALDHWSVQTLDVVQLLGAQHQWGVIRSNKLLRQLRIPPSRTVQTLTASERLALTAALPQT